MRKKGVAAIGVLVVALAWALWTAHGRVDRDATPSADTPAERAPDTPESERRTPPVPETGGDALLAQLFHDHRSNVVVEAAATVTRTLADDTQGSRHQRCLVRLTSGQSLLIAHNIDLAPRVPLSRGDHVRFRGEYEWNDRGGVVHWTHRDRAGHHPDGWIEWQGKKFD